MNRSAGGTMSFESPNDKQAAFAMAKRAAKALGLRAAAVDVFTDIGGDPAAMRVIEVNANPSIRFLEDSGRSDLILKIWRHTFSAIGLLDV
jgi:glutathione synthase/RimK-type ligase-like ATP-grasp enzyme